jgi:hypothetical protein
MNFWCFLTLGKHKTKTMKHLLLALTFSGCLAISSCNSDDNDNNNIVIPVVTSSLTATVDGSPVTFDAPTVAKENHTTEEGVPYTDLIVTALKKNDPSTKIIFRLEHMTTGPESCYYFLYQVGEAEHDIENNGTEDVFDVNITDNTEHNIKGNFSGTLADFTGNTVTIANGNFNVSF